MGDPEAGHLRVSSSLPVYTQKHAKACTSCAHIHIQENDKKEGKEKGSEEKERKGGEWGKRRKEEGGRTSNP